ncbi:MAG: transglutaminase domain-containing protein [Dehalococcoidia bacterium]
MLLAVLAPVGVTFSRLSMWHGFTVPWPAFLAGALCCGLATTQRRAGWWVLTVLVLGIVATVLTLVVLVPGPSLALRDEQVRSHLLLWINGVRDNTQIFDDLAVDAWSTAVAWLIGMWLAWAALRAGWHWIVLAVCGATLAATIRYLPNSPAESMAVFAFAALLLLARIHHRALVADAKQRGVPRPDRSLRAWGAQLTAITAGAAALVLGAWVLPAAHWRAPVLVHTSPSIAHRAGIAISTAPELKVLHDFGSVLPFSGQVSLGDGLVATVEAPGAGYLFGMSYDRYESSGWQTSAAEKPRQLAPVAAEAVPGVAGSERIGAHLTDGSAYLDSQPLDETVHVAEPASVLLAAGPPLGVPAAQVSGTKGLQFAPQALKGAPNGEYSALVAAVTLPAGGSYTTTGLISNADAAALRAADAAPLPDWIRANYLQVPASLPDRVRELAAQLTVGATTDYDRALAVQRYLRAMPYDESIAAPLPGEDGVDYLLFVARRGYCDYFASAMAMLLRTIHVPTRIVVGYVMHDMDRNGLFQVRERDAHAWTEVFFPGFGWQRFDATPGGAASFAPNAARLADAVSAASNPAIPKPIVPAQSEAPAPVLDVAAARAAGSPAGGTSAATYALWASVAGFLVMAGLYVWARLRGDPRGSALAAWRGATLAGRLTERRREPHETAYEYTAALTRENQRATGLQDVARAYSRARFGPRSAFIPAPRLWRRLASGVAGLVVGRIKRRRRGGMTK